MVNFGTLARQARKRPLTMVAVLALGSASLAVPALAATAKSGGSCTKAQVGKKSGTLTCKKSGTKYVWTKSTSTATTKAAIAQPLDVEAPSATPVNMDVILLSLGAAPASSASKVSIKCSGLGETPDTATKELSFGAAGGTNAVTFALQEPGANNPTGSTCGVTVTATGATPKIHVLVNGRAVATPAAGPLVTPNFSAFGSVVITAILEHASAAVPSTPVTTSLISPVGITTIPGVTVATLAPTATTPPPASGRSEIVTKFVTPAPASVTGVDVTTTCTAVTPGGAFQVVNNRLRSTDDIGYPQITLVPAAATAGTSCQVTATVLGATANTVNMRMLLNGNVVSGPSMGSQINSPAFAAGQAFRLTIELSFSGGFTTTGTPTGSVTTTTLFGTVPSVPPTTTGTSNLITITPQGTIPAGVVGYKVDTTCTNVLVNNVAAANSSFSSIFVSSGGTNPVNFAVTPNSTCQIAVSTIANGGLALGTVTINVGGVIRGQGAGGAAATAAFAAPSAFTANITIAF